MSRSWSEDQKREEEEEDERVAMATENRGRRGNSLGEDLRGEKDISFI